jgi:hypothetical protein
VIITALSGVGAAFSVVAVCAPLPELNIAAEASTANAVSKPFPRPIVVSVHLEVLCLQRLEVLIISL